MEFPPEVMRQQIAKEKSIKELQTILEQVVSLGLGKKAGSPNFKAWSSPDRRNLNRENLNGKIQSWIILNRLPLSWKNLNRETPHN